MLSGHSAINLDAKGRLAIPARHRGYILEEAEGKVVVTVNPNPKDKCLLVYPWHEWQPVQRSVMKLSNMDAAVQDFQRFFIGYAEEIELDGNGRFTITPQLRKYANLDKQVILIGMNNKFELWNSQAWGEKEQAFLENPEKIPDEVRNLVI